MAEKKALWGIIGAMDAEIALLKENMQAMSQREISGLTFYQGTLAGQEVVLVCCSVGKVNAAICAQTLAQVFGVTHLINTGVAGALDSRLDILDLVISQELCYHDGDLDIFSRYPPYASVYPGSPELISLAKQACEGMEDRNYSFYTGKIVSGDVFVSDKALKESIVARFAPMCVEMEGAAIAHVAYANKLPFVVLRSMSDKADDEADMSFDEFAGKAAVNSSALVIKMMELWSQNRQ